MSTYDDVLKVSSVRNAVLAYARKAAFKKAYEIGFEMGKLERGRHSLIRFGTFICGGIDAVAACTNPEN